MAGFVTFVILVPLLVVTPISSSSKEKTSVSGGDPKTNSELYGTKNIKLPGYDKMSTLFERWKTRRFSRCVEGSQGFYDHLQNCEMRCRLGPWMPVLPDPSGHNGPLGLHGPLGLPGPLGPPGVLGPPGSREALPQYPNRVKGCSEGTLGPYSHIQGCEIRCQSNTK